MSSTVWQLHGWQAHLQVGSFAGQVNLLAPHQGLSLTLGPENGVVVLDILGIELPSPAPGPENPPADSYVRGDDLVVVFAQAGPRPVRVEAYWRAGHSPAAMLSVELQVSVQTSLLESVPELVADSALPGAEVWQLRDPRAGVFERLSQPHGEAIRLQPEQGAGCLLFRLPGSSLSYAEMIHPSDFREDQLATAAADSDLTLRHRLFSGELEKGVILRGRVLGLLLPRENDQQAAAQAFAAFSESPPPLTT
ncbi:MAG: hypothetical protein HY000_07130 [Planctomycetes bacterium]|nr:hypothetical protein [Planctomycetota bacterium]